jgi:glycerol uptake facilitator-like aquaporin
VSVLPFIVAQLVGAMLACGLARFLWPKISDAAEVVVIPRKREQRQEVGVG